MYMKETQAPSDYRDYSSQQQPPFPLNQDQVRALPPDWENKSKVEIEELLEKWGEEFVNKNNWKPEEENFLKDFINKSPRAQQSEYDLILQKIVNQRSKQGKAAPATKKKRELIHQWIFFVRDKVEDLWREYTNSNQKQKQITREMKTVYEPLPSHELRKPKEKQQEGQIDN